MLLEWKTFDVDLPGMDNLLRGSLAVYDGMVCTEANLEIIFTEEPSEEVTNTVMQYWNGLSEPSESAKINRPGLLRDAIDSLRAGMVSKRYDDLSSIEKKILLGIGLSESEENSLIG